MGGRRGCWIAQVVGCVVVCSALMAACADPDDRVAESRALEDAEEGGESIGPTEPALVTTPATAVPLATTNGSISTEVPSVAQAPAATVLVTVPATVPATVAAATSPATPSPPIPSVDDMGAATSVAAQFVDAVRAGDQRAAEGLEAIRYSPTVFTWARGIGAANGFAWWGPPRCTVAGDGASCSFMMADPAPVLNLVRRDGGWLITHPTYGDEDIDDTSVGTMCVVDTTPLNFRGGPGLDWPAFSAIPVGDCTVEGTVTVRTAASNGRPWRLVAWNGMEGWVSDLKLAFP